jgi:hypothetical protein
MKSMTRVGEIGNIAVFWWTRLRDQDFAGKTQAQLWDFGQRRGRERVK